MVIILIITISFTRFKQEVTSNHFKNGASKTPDVSGRVVVSTNNDFWGTLSDKEKKQDI
jgi:hypothetical protein